MASIEKYSKPEYLEHLDGRARVDAVTAEDVMQVYQSAAREFEAMGAELVSVAKKCEAMAADVRNAICDAAQAYRQEGKKIFGRIEERVLLAQDVRKTCEDVRRRIGVSAAIGSPSSKSGRIDP